jgi:BON domain
MTRVKRLAIALTLLCGPLMSAAFAQRSNVWSDPFVNVTNALPACPVPAGPMFSPEEARADSHWRSQRGVSCYLSGRCRLSNSYLYDQEIIPRVRQFILADGRFEQSSIWVMGQRRWVWLMGCVGSESERQTLEVLVRNIDDVEAVVNELMVGTSGRPAYEVVAPPPPAAAKGR